MAITEEDIKKALPRGTAHAVTDILIDKINAMSDDLYMMEQKDIDFELMSNMNLMKDMKIDLDDYVNAVKYVIAKRYMSNRKAWELVFPDRLAKAEAKIAREEEKKARGEKWNQVNIDSMVSAVNTNQIVVALEAQLMIAVHVQYAPMFHAAVKKQFDLMNGKAAPNADGEPMTVSPTVQQLAASKLAELTARPADNNFELKVGMTDEAMSSQQALADQLGAMAKAQMAQLASGKSLSDVQKLGIATVEVTVED